MEEGAWTQHIVQTHYWLGVRYRAVVDTAILKAH